MAIAECIGLIIDKVYCMVLVRSNTIRTGYRS
jgi:hypothetical protein